MKDTFLKRYFLLYLITTIGFLTISAQEIPELTPKDFTGIVISGNNFYDGNALWGYMNGGADLYLEYGFEGLRVQEIEIDGIALKLEIFRMESPLSAFGMMSIKRFRCVESSLLAEDDCFTNYQYQAVKGDFYVNVINFTGNEQAKAITKEVARKLLQLIDKVEITIPAFAEVDNKYINPGELKYVKGTLGLQNGISKWIRLFDGISGFQLFYLPVTSDEGRIFFADIFFPTPETQTSFIQAKFDSAKVFPYFVTIENKSYGINPLSPNSVRLTEIQNDKAHFADLLKVFGF